MIKKTIVRWRVSILYGYCFQMLQFISIHALELAQQNHTKHTSTDALQIQYNKNVYTKKLLLRKTRWPSFCPLSTALQVDTECRRLLPLTHSVEQLRHEQFSFTATNAYILILSLSLTTIVLFQGPSCEFHSFVSILQFPVECDQHFIPFCKIHSLLNSNLSINFGHWSVAFFLLIPQVFKKYIGERDLWCCLFSEKSNIKQRSLNSPFFFFFSKCPTYCIGRSHT